MFKKKKPYKWKSPYGPSLVMIFVSIIVFTLFVFFRREDLDASIIIGSGTGLALAYITDFFIVYKKNKKNKEKKDNIPEVDERVINNMLRFSSYTAHGFIFILFLILTILIFLRIDNIPILYIWIYGFIYMAVTGIGNLYIKNR